MKEKIEFAPSTVLDVNYVDKEVSISDLKIAGNRILEIANASVPSYYVEECRRFNHFEIPVITSDNMVLSHMEDIRAAFALEQNKIQVKVAENLDEKEFIRFTLKTMFFFELPHEIRYELISLLTEHLETVDKAWYNELQLLGKNDINDKLGYILNCNKESVKLVKRKQVKGTLKSAQQKINAMINDQPVEQKPNNVTNLDQLRFDEITIKKVDGQNVLYINNVRVDTPAGFSFRHIGRKLHIEFDLDNFQINDPQNQAA